MPVRVRLPAALREYAQGRDVVVLPGAPGTVDEALAALGVQFPVVRDRVLTETGEVRPHVQVFVGLESIRWTGGLATALPDEAEIHIVPAVSGG